MSVDVDVIADLEVLRAVAEPMRWSILQLLAEEDLCVCHLVEELHVAQPLVSHHLRVLREAGLVTTSRHRYWTYYRLEPSALDSVSKGISELAQVTPGSDSRRRPCC